MKIQEFECLLPVLLINLFKLFSLANKTIKQNQGNLANDRETGGLHAGLHAKYSVCFFVFKKIYNMKIQQLIKGLITLKAIQRIDKHKIHLHL